jgi:hypothetical protein
LTAHTRHSVRQSLRVRFLAARFASELISTFDWRDRCFPSTGASSAGIPP